MKGGVEQFERAALPHTRALLRFALRLTRNHAGAEDLVQETLLLAWRSFHQLQPDTNTRAWLFRILINAFYSESRRARPEVALDLSLPQDWNGPQDIEVLQSLDRLGPEQRTVLLLAAVEGFTCREISGILTIPIGTVMSRLSRARTIMRELLSPVHPASSEKALR